MELNIAQRTLPIGAIRVHGESQLTRAAARPARNPVHVRLEAQTPKRDDTDRANNLQRRAGIAGWIDQDAVDPSEGRDGRAALILRGALNGRLTRDSVEKLLPQPLPRQKNMYIALFVEVPK